MSKGNANRGKPWPEADLPGGTLRAKSGDLVAYVVQALMHPDENHGQPPMGLVFFEGTLPFRGVAADMVDFLRMTGFGSRVFLGAQYDRQRNQLSILIGNKTLLTYSTKTPVPKAYRPIFEPAARQLGVPREDMVRMFASYGRGKPAKQPSENQKSAVPVNVNELGLDKRSEKALIDAGLENADEVLSLLAQGEDKVLEVDGFGDKSLIALKTQLESHGFELPEAS